MKNDGLSLSPFLWISSAPLRVPMKSKAPWFSSKPNIGSGRAEKMPFASLSVATINASRWSWK